MSDLAAMINLTLAFIFGGLIGFVREKEGKTAGLRTHILVSLGSCLLMILSAQMLQLSGMADPGRIAAGLITGIGFIGAGAIVQGGGSVMGLTTAASLWVTSAIGMACGSGYYLAATFTTILTLFVLQSLRWLESKIIKSKPHMEKD
ncbi:MAG: MgtC/SapB family protein [Candidatus Margulisbacteria bacterium]|nr:MgtC/SapB family protein [Candidatus Margulisiibacteriota bacterium]